MVDNGDLALNYAPSVTVVSIGRGDTGEAIPLVYYLIDEERELCQVTFEWSDDGGVTWKPCTSFSGTDLIANGEGTQDLTSLPAGLGGKRHRFVWNAAADTLPSNQWILLRVTPKDPYQRGSSAIHSLFVSGWESPQTVPNTSQALRVATAVDSSGIVHIAYLLNSGIHYNFYNGKNWDSSPTQIHSSAVTNGTQEVIDDSIDMQVDATNNVHVIWVEKDTTTGDKKIYYISSASASFGSDAELVSGTLTNSQHPQMAVSPQGEVYAVWQDSGSIYLNTNSGTGWGTPQAVYSPSTTVASTPDIALDIASNQYVIVWIETDNTGSTYSLQGKTSTSTSPFTVLQNVTSYYLETPQVIIDHSHTIHLVWVQQNSLTFERQLYYSFSQDGGKNWSSPTLMFSNLKQSQNPHLALNQEGEVHLVWAETVGGAQEIYTACKLPGRNWSPPQKVSQLNGNASFPYLAFGGEQQKLALLWIADVSGSQEIYFSQKKWHLWTKPAQVPTSTQIAYPQVVVDPFSNTHFFWQATSGASLEKIFYFMKSFQSGWQGSPTLVSHPNSLAREVRPIATTDSSGNLPLPHLDCQNRCHSTLATLLPAKSGKHLVSHRSLDFL